MLDCISATVFPYARVIIRLGLFCIIYSQINVLIAAVIFITFRPLRLLVSSSGEINMQLVKKKDIYPRRNL